MPFYVYFVSWLLGKEKSHFDEDRKGKTDSILRKKSNIQLFVYFWWSSLTQSELCFRRKSRSRLRMKHPNSYSNDPMLAWCWHTRSASVVVQPARFSSTSEPTLSTSDDKCVVKPLCAVCLWNASQLKRAGLDKSFLCATDLLSRQSLFKLPRIKKSTTSVLHAKDLSRLAYSKEIKKQAKTYIASRVQSSRVWPNAIFKFGDLRQVVAIVSPNHQIRACLGDVEHFVIRQTLRFTSKRVIVDHFPCTGAKIVQLGLFVVWRPRTDRKKLI